MAFLRWLVAAVLDLASTLPPVHQLSKRCSTPGSASSSSERFLSKESQDAGNFGCKTNRIRSNFGYVYINICLHAPVWEYLYDMYPCTKSWNRFGSCWAWLGLKNWFITRCGIWRDSNYTTIMFKRLFDPSVDNWLYYVIIGSTSYVMNNWHLSYEYYYHLYWTLIIPIYLSHPNTSLILSICKNHQTSTQKKQPKPTSINHPLAHSVMAARLWSFTTSAAWKSHQLSWRLKVSTLGSPGAIHPLCQKFRHLSTNQPRHAFLKHQTGGSWLVIFVYTIEMKKKLHCRTILSHLTFNANKQRTLLSILVSSCTKTKWRASHGKQFCAGGRWVTLSPNSGQRPFAHTNWQCD